MDYADGKMNWARVLIVVGLIAAWSTAVDARPGRGAGHGHRHGGSGIVGRIHLAVPRIVPAFPVFPVYRYVPSYYYPAAVPIPAPVYIERGSESGISQPPSAYWYYCENPQGYYPYVTECPAGWQPVAPQPPSMTIAPP